ncbi:MAG: SDR family oxidoreductase [Alphaproteobacteria bacterium GM7ARS4]|nr:SDR family oxidoreductase [Alphaproteobacteria bacterium GM7ARS4]
MTTQHTQKDKPLMVITGASRRIGATLARFFSPHWQLALHARQDNDDIQTLSRQLAQKGGIALVFFADFRTTGERSTLIPNIIKRMGTAPQCLINNASVFLKDSLRKEQPDHWHENILVNLHAPMQLIRSFHIHRPRHTPSCVINITDQRVLNPTPYFMSYTLSKSALHTLTHTAALALAPHVRVNAIAPGPVMPDSTQTDEAFRRQCLAMPLQQGGDLKDICHAAQFLTEASSVTGQTIAVDGGQHLGYRHTS